LPENVYPAGRLVGFIFAEILFSSVLFFALSFTGKIIQSAGSLSYFAAAIIIVFAIYWVSLKCISAGFFSDARRGFEDFGKIITSVVNFFLLLLVYVLGVGMSAVITRISGKKVMDMTVDKSAKSYWKEYRHGTESKDGHYRQF